MNLKNKKAESLVGIVVGVFILSFVLLGIGNLIGNSKQTISDFNTKMEIDILKNNAKNILYKINLNSLNEGQKYYIYKNNSSKKFEIKNSIFPVNNKKYMYIDKYGNKINNLNNFDGNIYIRYFKIKKITFLGINEIIPNIEINKFNY